MRHATRIAALCLAALCSLPIAAFAIGVCEVEIDQPLTGRGFYFSADTQRWQEFVPSRSVVCEVRLVIRADRLGGDLLLRIEDEGGAMLSETTIEEADVILGDAEYEFRSSTHVDRDEIHRLVLRSSEPDDFPAAYFWKGDEASTYDAGHSDIHEGGMPGFDYAFAVSTVTPTDVPPGQGARLSALFDAAPNPFNPTTSLGFELSVGMHVRLTVHDVAGRHVRTVTDGWWDSGSHSVLWDGRDDAARPLASGAYVVRLEAGGVSESRRVVLLK